MCLPSRQSCGRCATRIWVERAALHQQKPPPIDPPWRGVVHNPQQGVSHAAAHKPQQRVGRAAPLPPLHTCAHLRLLGAQPPQVACLRLKQEVPRLAVLVHTPLRLHRAMGAGMYPSCAGVPVGAHRSAGWEGAATRPHRRVPVQLPALGLGVALARVVRGGICARHDLSVELPLFVHLLAVLRPARRVRMCSRVRMCGRVESVGVRGLGMCGCVW
jgi:hypothetical protein